MRVGIDLMGSEKSPQALFESLVKASRSLSKVSEIHLFVTPTIQREIASLAHELPLHFHVFDHVIEMGDDPVRSLREKPEATLIQGIKALREKLIDVFITASNTGALISASSLFLPKKEGVKRPALMASLPTRKGVVTLIDAGASVQMKPALMYHFAEIGINHAKTVHGKANPTVGLLNVGQESQKGTLEHRDAFEKLSKLPTFKGNIEPDRMFQGDVDVIVADGFSGNILLKTAEGVSEFIFQALQETASEGLQPEIEALKKRFEYADFPGARVVGVEGTVIKIHGNAHPDALIHCLQALKRE